MIFLTVEMMEQQLFLQMVPVLEIIDPVVLVLVSFFLRVSESILPKQPINSSGFVLLGG